jgi:hypothetical protein
MQLDRADPAACSASACAKALWGRPPFTFSTHGQRTTQCAVRTAGTLVRERQILQLHWYILN